MKNRTYTLILNFVAMIIVSGNAYTQSDTNIDSMRNELHKKKISDLEKNELLTQIANAYVYKNLDSAEYYIDQVIENPLTKNNDTLYRPYLVKAWVYHGKMDYNNAKRYYEETINRVKTAKDTFKQVEVQLNYAALLVELKEDKSLAILDDINMYWDIENDESHQRNWVLGEVLRARYYQLTDQYNKGIKTLLQIMQKPFFEAEHLRKKRLGVFNVYAIILDRLGRNDDAIHFTLMALNNVGKLHDYERKLLLGNIAEKYLKKENYDSVQHYLKLHDQLTPITNSECATSEHVWGKMYYYQNEMEKGYQHAIKSIECVEQIDNKKLHINALLLKSSCCLPLKKIKEGRSALENAIELVTKNPSISTHAIKRKISLLKLQYKQVSIQPSLNELLEQYRVTNDSFYQAVTQKQTKELLVQYETEKKEQRIALLEQEEATRNAELKQKNTLLASGGLGLIGLGFISMLLYNNNKKRKQLNQLLEARNVDIRHRVRNHLNTLSIFTRGQANRIDDENAKQVMTALNSRIHVVALIDQKLNAAHTKDEINMREYIHALVPDWKAMFPYDDRSIDIQAEIEPLLFHPDAAINVGLIINELINNSYKHAFRDGPQPTIHILLRRQAGKLQLRYKDNGVGISEASKTQRKDGSYGWYIIDTLTQQHYGHYKIKQTTGMDIQFTFPKMKELMAG